MSESARGVRIDPVSGLRVPWPSTTSCPLDTALIEHLDFTPRCDVAAFVRILLWWMPRGDCRRKATWVGTTPCCGAHGLCCDRHRYEQAIRECPRCGRQHRSDRGFKWARL